MTLLAGLPAAEGWQVEIVATDLSTRMLRRAGEALWPIAAAQDIPPHHLKAFMLRGVGDQDGWMKAGPELRAVVRTARLICTSGPIRWPAASTSSCAATC